MTRKTIVGNSLKMVAVLLFLCWIVLFGRALERGPLPGVAVVGFAFAAMIYESGAKFKAK
jgi:hypothetical protein